MEILTFLLGKVLFLRLELLIFFLTGKIDGVKLTEFDRWRAFISTSVSVYLIYEIFLVETINK